MQFVINLADNQPNILVITTYNMKKAIGDEYFNVTSGLVKFSKGMPKPVLGFVIEIIIQTMNTHFCFYLLYF